MENQPRRRVKARCMRSFMKFCFNPKKKTCMERTFTSWLKIIVYYIGFFGVVCGFTAGMIILSGYLIHRYDSLVVERTGGPGLSQRPAVTISSNVIWYEWKEKNTKPYLIYVKDIQKLLKSYENAKMDDYVTCDAGTKDRKKPCYFNITNLGPCASTEYGYDSMTPCVYLKLNKIFNWKPKCYDKLPNKLPQNLKEQLQESNRTSNEQSIFLSCGGINPADEEHLGEIKYYPVSGFEANFFPLKKRDKNFLPPLVAVQFVNPQIGTLISIRCHAWAKNILEGRHADFQLYLGFKN